MDSENRFSPQTGNDTTIVAGLLQPYRIGNLALPSRFVMAPMTRNFAPGGVLTDASVGYYRRRAESGLGLLISEGTWIDHPAAKNHSQKATWANAPDFFGEAATQAWANVLAAVHDSGSRMFPQLWHVGLVQRARGSDYQPVAASVSPSGIVYSAQKSAWVEKGPPMSQQDIDEVVDSFGRAAKLAYRMGFDGIEIHAAHGYLIDQFFWNVTNRRTDGYGGSIANRARFATEIVSECRRMTAPDFPISLRFSQWKADDYGARIFEQPHDMEELLLPLVEAGVDIFHCSTRRYWIPAFAGSDRTLAGWARKITGKPVICVGSIGLGVEFDSNAEKTYELPAAEGESLANLQAMFDRGEFDLAAVGRSLLANPDWLAKLKSGRFEELKPYTPDMKETLY